MMMSERCVARVIQKLNITFKLIRLASITQNSERNKHSRYILSQAFIEMYISIISMNSLHISDVVYIDKTGFNLHLRRRNGRSERDTRVNLVVATAKGENISVCASINSDGLIDYLFVIGAYSTAKFISYLQEWCNILREEEKYSLWTLCDYSRLNCLKKLFRE